ncbi:molybdopterin molybdenumtransferase [Pseudonocardia asaccharolytica DSM 44247 = NBRC 16224]|uniref:Molybdopterin molybdenumtransferase n=1 Tax=Pseudonocardia asaccharolytica DSM 44247 = NBRC 16224 TaxID=1123024 RepID=A0A511CVI2_9PSEU|nr:molybdopterin molybdenumtransferase [Pseudonocardia asaccharolytica DSM 44247 = NBRC 16224]
MARSVAEHAALAAALVGPSGVERRALGSCAGRVLAEPVHAMDDLPAFDNSAMNGYALRVADIDTAGMPVAAEIPAGHGVPPPLAPGTAHRIMTGAPLPRGADSVVPVGLTDGGRDIVRVTGPGRSPRAGTSRRRGEGIAAGEVVLPAGTRMGPAQLAAAAAADATALAVHRRLRVGVLSAGSELEAVGRTRRHGQIHDTNGILLVTALAEAGAQPVQLPLVADRPGELAALLARYLGELDLLVTSGGISAGDHEVVKDTLGPRGVGFGHLALKPGGAQGLGILDGTPVIALPGNPVACWVSFELFVRPAVRAAMGLPAGRPRRSVRSGVALRSRAGRWEYVPTVLDDAVDEARPVDAPGPHSYRALAGVNCLREFDASGRGARAGDPVDVLLLATGEEEPLVRAGERPSPSSAAGAHWVRSRSARGTACSDGRDRATPTGPRSRSR